MQIIIFLLEIIVIFVLIEIDSLPSQSKYIERQDSTYHSYYAINISGKYDLVLSNTPNQQKVLAWRDSFLKDEMLLHFPDLHHMSKFVNKRVVDNGNFKNELIGYMENIHGEYASGDINMAMYKEAMLNPNPSLPAY
ncbi:MAG: hypothetical protein K0U38_10095 [Epsilonproteobacteria bacterium]|nr:hypothetical protein [Campylobacterota bacterium]